MDSMIWGTATAAYQTEGAVSLDGRGKCIWDVFGKNHGAIANDDEATIADDSYHKVKEDVKLMRDMGLTAYRFSISWSRILPSGSGKVNQAGLDHYNALINELISVDIIPFVTLYHWDLPQGLQEEYDGLLNGAKFEADFVAFADICFKNFGDRVKKWVTINEPWTISYMGYGIGVHAPGRCTNRKKCEHGDSSTEPYIVAHNLLNAHAAAVEHYRKHYQHHQDGEIGIVLNLDWGEPLTTSFIDNCAAVRHNEFQFGWFADPIIFGRYPSTMQKALMSPTNKTQSRLPQFTTDQRDRLLGSVDFLGLNHYSTRYYVDETYRGSIGKDSLLYSGNQHKILEGGDAGEGWAYDQHSASTKYSLDGTLIGPQGESDWLNVVPWGLFDVLMYVHNRYSIAYKVDEDFQNNLEMVALRGSESRSNTNIQENRMKRRMNAKSTEQQMNNSKKNEAERKTTHIPIYITENGCDAPGEAKMSMDEVVHDSFRVNYLSSYLSEVQRARAWGVDIRGYFVWSLLDNFEWADGFDKRFGIVHVDYSSPNRSRTLKDSARWYSAYIRAGGVDNSSTGSRGGIMESSMRRSRDGGRTGHLAMVGDPLPDLLASGIWSTLVVVAIVLCITVMMRFANLFKKT